MRTNEPFDPVAGDPGPYDDEMFDIAAAEAGAWVPGPYGADDELGTYNEVTPERTAAAIARLDTSRPIETFALSETLFNGFPAYADREHEQLLVVEGYTPPSDFEGVFRGPEPLHWNRESVHEERLRTSFNLGTKINGLQHTGIGDLFYNGFRGPEIARSWGTARLGNERGFPIVTRGILLDVLGWKIALGEEKNFFRAPNGNPVLRPNYRITVEDILATLAHQGMEDDIGPGDAVLFRTGWSNLIRDDPDRYLGGGPPGPWLREMKFLAARRPAILANDTWCFESLDPKLTKGAATPGHQLLSMKYGVRIGEAVRTQELADAGIFDFVFLHTPQPSEGAVAGGGPCAAMGQRPID